MSSIAQCAVAPTNMYLEIRANFLGHNPRNLGSTTASSNQQNMETRLPKKLLSYNVNVLISVLFCIEQLSMFLEYFISRWEIPFKLTQISGNLIEGLSKTFIPLKLHSIGLIRFNILENWTYRYNLEAPVLYYIASHSHTTWPWKTRWRWKEIYFQWILRILFHCCERDIFQEGQFWLYPVLIPIHDGGTRVIKLIRLGYVLWNWASTLQIFCLIHYWTFHRILINLEKRGWMLFTTIVVIFLIGQKSPGWVSFII